MNVIGLDLSLTAPGLSVGDTHGATLHTDAKRGDKRLCDIRDWIEYHLIAFRPVLAVIEAVPPYDHASSSLERVHGPAREILARHDVPIAYVNVSALKSFATGNGRADKGGVMAAVESMSGWAPGDDNQADAWVARRMGRLAFAPGSSQLHGHPHRIAALSSVAWPLDLVAPYGAISARKPVTKKCGHKVIVLRNGGDWLHPFTVDRCDKPPK